ncbi:MAG: hypothetical protein LBI42_09465 [Chitinispirillales bacterium]|jgi:hypothetical protein|nr:hypothetical protein [Chitinispirillales bacterium]
MKKFFLTAILIITLLYINTITAHESSECEEVIYTHKDTISNPQRLNLSGIAGTSFGWRSEPFKVGDSVLTATGLDFKTFFNLFVDVSPLIAFIPEEMVWLGCGVGVSYTSFFYESNNFNWVNYWSTAQIDLSPGIMIGNRNKYVDIYVNIYSPFEEYSRGQNFLTGEKWIAYYSDEKNDALVINGRYNFIGAGTSFPIQNYKAPSTSVSLFLPVSKLLGSVAEGSEIVPSFKHTFHKSTGTTVLSMGYQYSF